MFITDQPDDDIAFLEARHRAHARVEDRIRCAKQTGLRNLPFFDFGANAVWLQLVLVAADLLAWLASLLDSEARAWEPPLDDAGLWNRLPPAERDLKRAAVEAGEWREDATLRPLAVLNRLLTESGSQRRFGVLYAGGNEGIAHLQPEAVWHVLRSIPAWGSKNRPTVP